MLAAGGMGKTMEKYAIIALICIAVASCATQAQKQSQIISDAGELAGAELTICVSAAGNDPAISALRANMPDNANDLTLSQQTNASKATDEEIAMIYIRHEKLQVCRNKYIAAISPVMPGIANAMVEVYTKTDKELIRLVKKEISWGDYVVARRDIATAGRTTVTAEGQRIDDALRQSHNGEMAERQAAAENFAAYIQTQQMINAMNRPVTTQCTRFGNTVNCTSN
jgi:citrate lyase beta subunit